MNKKSAYNSFVYHGDRIYSITGQHQPYHEAMHQKWAIAYDSGFYKQLPDDVLQADVILSNMSMEELKQKVQRVRAPKIIVQSHLRRTKSRPHIVRQHLRTSKYPKRVVE